MTRAAEEVLAAALTLSEEERVRIAAELLDSVKELPAEENERLWAEEGERRYAAYQAGEIESAPAEEVFARLRARAK